MSTISSNTSRPTSRRTSGTGLGECFQIQLSNSEGRHCEERWRRSNPVCRLNLDCFAIARNDVHRYSRGVVRARVLRSSAQTGGAGNAGRQSRTRSLACKLKKHASVVTTGQPATARHSPRDGVTVYSVLSPAIGSLSPSSFRSTGFETSSRQRRGAKTTRLHRPRSSAARRAARSRPSRSVLTLMTMRNAPSIEHETRGEVAVICPSAQQIRMRHVDTTGKSARRALLP
jgi:hypothetical protein